MNGESASVVTEFYPPLQPLLEQIGQSQKALERLGARQKLHEQIDITIRASIAAQNRSE